MVSRFDSLKPRKADSSTNFEAAPRRLCGRLPANGQSNSWLLGCTLMPFVLYVGEMDSIDAANRKEVGVFGRDYMSGL